jgi:zinc/manganese transport system substrate-binding protein
VISFHKTLSYFFDRFGVTNTTLIEPLPGIPPTAKHSLEVIAAAKAKAIPLIMVENFFDPAAAKRIASEVAGMRVAVVPVAVGGDAEISSLDALYEKLVQVMEAKK